MIFMVDLWRLARGVGGYFWGALIYEDPRLKAIDEGWP